MAFPLNLLRLNPDEQATCRKILDTTDAWIARNINKRISLPVSILLARAGVTPNQITCFNLLLGILSGVIAAFGGYQNLLLAGIMFQLVSIIDGCDGEVAKLNQKATRFGAWFDTVGDNLSFVVFITGVTFGLYQETHEAWILNLAKLSLFSFAVLLSIMVSYLIQQKGSSASLVTYEKEVISAKAKKQNPLVAKLVHYGKFLVKKDFFAFLFFFLAAVDLPQAIVFFSALGTSFIALVLSVITLKGYRARKALAAKTLVNEEAPGVSS
jgi:phosphatidylglycerophosphate synthase